MQNRQYVYALDIRNLAGREATDARNQELGRHAVALVGLHHPSIACLVIRGRRDARVELYVFSEVEAVGNVIQVGQDLRLLGVLSAPFPLLEQILVERKAVNIGR